jgi:hypothetical protein
MKHKRCVGGDDLEIEEGVEAEGGVERQDLEGGQAPFWPLRHPVFQDQKRRLLQYNIRVEHLAIARRGTSVPEHVCRYKIIKCSGLKLVSLPTVMLLFIMPDSPITAGTVCT